MREPGLYFNLPNEVYHSENFAIGNSGLKAIGRSPAYYFGQYLDPRKPPKEDKETPARLFGNMVHTALFEFAAYNQRYKVGPDVNKNTNTWKDFKKECEACGAQPVDLEQYEKGLMAREAALRVPDIKAVLSAGVGEVSAYGIDPETGARVKVRPDWVHPVSSGEVILCDGKTYNSADPIDFAKQAVKMDYDQQGALYPDAYQWASGQRVLGMIFIVIEDEYPFVTAQMELDAEAVANGKRKYRRRLNAYAEALKTGVWPGIGTDLKTVSLPAWAIEE